MKLRIQDYNLRLSDIMNYPAWEYALDEESIDGQDERTVRPYQLNPLLNPSKAYIIVRATFDLADGTQMKGLIKPYYLPGQHISSPVIPYDLLPSLVTEKQQIHFCCGAIKPNYDEISVIYRLIEKHPNEVFPIEFRSDIEILDSITEGTIKGFMFIDENTKDFFNMQSSDIIFIK